MTWITNSISDRLDRPRWRKLCTTLGFPVDDATFDALAVAYEEPQRAYHNAVHLNECLAWFDVVSELALQPALLEVALWFHDAVYHPASNDNEEASARCAHDWLRTHGAPQSSITEVYKAILATRHDEVPHGDDAQLLVDIDLAILGAPQERFDEYEQQVRQEYRWVPDFLFRQRRAELLERFLSRPRIYATNHFADRLERQARGNLQRSLHQLKASP